MIYLEKSDLIIRTLEEKDIDQIILEEKLQGWHPTRVKYESRLNDQNEGISIALVAIFKNEIAGYINLYKTVKHGPYKDLSLPEIVDLGVFERFRNQGVGNELMELVEDIARKDSEYIYLSVGLHSGYGNAQKLYVKRGYIPDGKGAYFRDIKAKPYQEYVLGDDLVIYMSKRL